MDKYGALVVEETMLFGKMLSARNQHSWRKYYPSSSYSTIYTAWTAVKLLPGLCHEEELE
jgi:hypothetical protein